eukprot:7620976-Pyramimonas_sp.AAC.1
MFSERPPKVSRLRDDGSQPPSVGARCPRRVPQEAKHLVSAGTPRRPTRPPTPLQDGPSSPQEGPGTA